MQRAITQENPDGEEGDGEEVADEDKRFLDQTGQQPNRATNWPNLEVAETATLKSSEVLVYWKTVSYRDLTKESAYILSAAKSA